MEALAFPRGNYYQILCKTGDQALRVQENQSSKYNKSKIISTQSNPQDNHQIFMVEKVGLGDDEYEIVSCPTALVIDGEKEEIRLRAGKQAKDQLFSIKLAPVQAYYKYYWIQTDKKGTQALALEGVLRKKKFDPNNDSQLFRFEMVTNTAIQGSAVILNNYSGKALDVPEATWEKGQRIIQWQKNKRWNQRWRFIKQGKGVMIQSLFNGLVLDIAEEKKKSGSKVIQWQKTGNSNQQWFPEPAGNGLFKFRSCHEPSLFLAIKDKNVQDKGLLEVCGDQNASMYWRIEGAQP